MTRETRGDAIGPESFSIAELRAAALRGKGELSRPLALSLLGRAKYPQKTRDMERLLLDEKETPRLRAMAAQILGQSGTPAALRALERGLSIGDDVALRGVLHGLSLAGGEKERQAVQSLARRRGAVGTAVKAASTLLGHRLAARTGALRAPGKLLRISPKAAVPIRITAASGRRVSEAVAAATAAVPALRLSPQGAVSIECFDRKLVFALTEEIAKGGAARLAEGRAQVGVVVGRKEREDTAWEVKYHVLTDPQRGGDVRIHVTNARGRVLYAGTARVRGERTEFTLRAVDAPGVAAIDLRGAFEKGRLTFTEARSDPRRRRRSPEPKLRGGTAQA